MNGTNLVNNLFLAIERSANKGLVTFNKPEIGDVDQLIARTLEQGIYLGLEAAIDRARTNEARQQCGELQTSPSSRPNTETQMSFEDILNRAKNEIDQNQDLEARLEAMLQASTAILELTERKSNSFYLSSYS